MSESDLDEDQRDALQEIGNIGMGKTGAALARLLGSFVTLSVPASRLISVPELVAYLAEQNDASPVVRQAFLSNLSGEALVLFGRDGYRELHELMGYDSAAQTAEPELLFDIASLLVGGYLQSVFEQLGQTLSFTAPTAVSLSALQQTLQQGGSPRWQTALLQNVYFTLEHGGFVAQLVILLPDSAIRSMKEALDEFLRSL